MYCLVVAHLAFENVHNVYFCGAATAEGSIEPTPWAVLLIRVLIQVLGALKKVTCNRFYNVH